MADADDQMRCHYHPQQVAHVRCGRKVPRLTRWSSSAGDGSLLGCPRDSQVPEWQAKAPERLTSGGDQAGRRRHARAGAAGDLKREVEGPTRPCDSSR